MIQEIITYIVIALAVFFAVSKTLKKLRRRKKAGLAKRPGKTSSGNFHDCSDCSAECMLRDTTTITLDKNKILCEKTQQQQTD